MAFFNFSRWLRSRPRTKTYRKNPRFVPGLEALEDRTLMSTLPTAVETNPTTISSVGVNNFSPDVVQDPINPLKLVEVQTTGALLTAQFSVNGGETWTAFGAFANKTDPTTNLPFTTVTNPTVAMDRAENVYITDIERNATLATSGELVFQRYLFTSLATPTVVAGEGNKVLQEWVGADPIENPVVAVDNNVSSFKDTTITPNTTQADTLATLVHPAGDPNPAGVDKALYVAWNTSNKVPTTVPVGGFNPNEIMVAGSGNGGASFTAPQFANTGNNVLTALGSTDATPQIVFTQGSANGTVAGGQLVFVWNDFANSQIVLDSSQPDGGISAANAAASQTFVGATGAISDGFAQVINPVAIAGGGGGYTAGQTVTVAGGTVGTGFAAAQLQIDSVTSGPPGPVGAAHVTNPATNGYLIKPAGSPTDTSGGGATYTLTYGPDVAVTTEFDDVIAAAPTFTPTDLQVTLNLTDPNDTNLDIQLVSPDGTTIQLVRNNIDGTGAPVVPAQGITGANLGEITTAPTTYQVGTVFDDNAPRSIADTSFTGPYIGHFTAEVGKLDVSAHTVGAGATIKGTWQLLVTDHKNDGEVSVATEPKQSVDSWSLTFSQINTTGFGKDLVVTTGTAKPLAGAANQPYPNNSGSGFPDAGAQGIGPSISVAVDNSLGAFSPFEGRLYIAYTTAASAIASATTDTNVFLVSGDNLKPSTAPTWNTPVKVNDDSIGDTFSEGNRPQFMPTVAVDQVTGTVGVMYYDGRWDPALTRVGNSFSDSIDGGQTFSTSTFLNTPKTAIDMITGANITIEPVPGNQKLANPVFGFGDRQGLVMNDGEAIPVFSSNNDIAGSVIMSATVTFAAGPRIDYSDMGPIANTFTFAPDDAEKGVDQPTVVYNTTFAPDGTRELSGFVVQFDRPVLISSFSAADITLEYRDTVTPATSAANLTISGALTPGAFGITAEDAGGDPTTGWGPQLLGGTTAGAMLARSFLISLTTPLSGVGTYSYAIGNLATGPAITDFIKTAARKTTGNVMDQNQNGFAGEFPDSVLSSAAIDSGGSGFKVNQLLAVPGGTPFAAATATSLSSAAILQVTAVDKFGAITGIKVYQPGAYSINPAIFVSIGSAAFALTFVNASGDVYAVPTPTAGGPFQLPYSQNTLPLIIPGPHVVNSATDASTNANVSTTATDNLVLNGTTNAVDVTFDRNTQAGSFTPANVLRIDGPAGPITPYTLGPAVTFTGGGGTGALGYATIVNGIITAVTVTNGGIGYTSAPTVVFNGGGGINATGTATVAGGAVTGVTVTNGGNGYTGLTTPQAIPDGGMLTVPITIADSLQVNDLTVGLSISHAQLADLTVFLTAPDGTSVQLFNETPGANLTKTIFDDNAANGIVAGTAPFTGSFSPVLHAITAPITGAGSGYNVGDILTVVGGTFSTPTQLTVTSVGAGGAISGVAITQAGAYSGKPLNPVTVTDATTPSASGATFAPTYAGLSAFNGKNYLGTWMLSITDNVVNAITGTLNSLSLNPLTVAPESFSVLAGAGIAAPGDAGYAVGDLVAVLGGTFTTQAQLTVTSVDPITGTITGVAIANPGVYTAAPSSPAVIMDISNGDATATLNLVFTTPYHVTFPTQTVSGTYTLTFGPDSQANYIKDTQLNSVSISTGGGGYVVGDVLTATGGTFTSPATFTVTAVDPITQAITGIETQLPGSYSIQPVSPVIVSGGSGGGALLNLIFGNEVDTNLNAGVDLLRGGNPLAATTNGFNGTLLPNTYPSGTINTAIPAGQTIDSTINVPQSYLVEGVTLSLTIQHQNDPDLTATLIAPDGTIVQLFTNVGTSGSSPHANFTNTTFDDTSLTPIQLAVTIPGTGIGAGPYDPQFPLSALKGHGSLGLWTLRITSISSTLNGTLVNWNLTLSNSVPGTGLGEQVADQFTASTRVFVQDPTNPVSQTQWTSVGPLPVNNNTAAGQVTSVTVDPADPSGNTVYAAGVGGGVWKTTNFLTTSANGPIWQPLTNTGPSNSIDVDNIAIFDRNNDPNQSIVFAATGAAAASVTTGTSAAGVQTTLPGNNPSAGVGFLRSPDGGKTWALFDSSVNVDASGNVLGINSAARNHLFVGATVFKIIADPTTEPDGQEILYMAVSGGKIGAQGIWRSVDTGGHWTLLQAGPATDVVLAVGSAGVNGNLQILYGAISGVGVFYTTNATTALSMSVQNGGQADPIRRNVDNIPDTAIPVGNDALNPGAGAMIALAVPAKTGSPLEDTLHEGWVYAVVQGVGGATSSGLFVTKDFGLNWTEIHLPEATITFPTAPPFTETIPTNDDGTGSDYNLSSSTKVVTIAIDPNNPSVVYVSGGFDILIRVDTTTLSDVYAEVAFDNSNNDGGLAQFATTGGVTVTNPGKTFGLEDPVTGTTISPFFNMLRDPNSPFLIPASLHFTNVASFTNTGYDATWSPYNVGSGTSVDSLVAITDPLTGHTRLIVGDQNGVYTGTDNGTGHLDLGIGTARSIIGSRNGNLAILELTAGAAQPSTLAADAAGALLYGMSTSIVRVGNTNNFFGLYGAPQSAADVLDTGNITWTGPNGGDTFVAGTGVATDQTGSGALYQYLWPCCGATPLESDFFQYTAAGNTAISRVTGLLQPGDDPATNIGQWPRFTGSTFAVNPIDPTGIVMSSQNGRLFLTSGSTLGTGIQWFPIGNPGQLDGTYAPAVAFGAPANATAPLDDFIYAGTTGGNVFVTFTGGGVGSPASWKSLGSPDGTSVEQIVADPSRGTHDLYVVTVKGVYFMADSTVAAPKWVTITGNLFVKAPTHVLFHDPAQVQATLQANSLTSIQADYRYAIPNAAGGIAIAAAPTGATESGNTVTITTSAAHGFSVGQAVQISGVGVAGYNGIVTIVSVTSPTTFTYTSSSTGLAASGGGTAIATHPVLYVAGNGGVYRSLDQGATWTYFPNIATDGALDDGGLLPDTDITSLTLSLGNVNPLNGEPSAPFGRNMLVATSFGTSAFAIRLDDQIIVPGGNALYTYAVNPVSGPHVVPPPSGTSLITGVTGVTGMTITFSGPVDPVTVKLADVNFVKDPFGNAIPILDIKDVTVVAPGAPNPHNVYQIDFVAPQTAFGFYSVSLGPNISDYSGDKMDQNQNLVNGENPGDVYNARWLFQPFANNAPVLSATSAAIQPAFEDATQASATPTPINNLVLSLGWPGSGLTDLDNTTYQANTPATLAPVGIAVTGVDDTNGMWEYSLDNGVTWNSFAAAGGVDSFPKAARLLEGNSNGIASPDLIEFLPNADFSGTSSFTFQGWDLTSGLGVYGQAGGTGDATANGGATAFSSGSATATINILFVNDQPSFTTAGNPPPALEDSGANTVSGFVTNFNPGGAPPSGDANESSQKVLQYLVSNVTNAGLFAAGGLPKVDNAGNLTYTLNPDLSGTSTFGLQVQDNGGTQVLAAAIAAGGINYVVGDKLAVLGGTGTSAVLEVTSTGAGGAVTGVAILADGAYNVQPANAVNVNDTTTPGASGATFNLTFATQALTAALTTAGSGYALGDLLQVQGGTPVGTPAEVQVTSVGAVTGFLAPANIIAGSTGYSVGDILNVVGGTFTTPATIRVMTVTAGVITSATVVSGGSYTVIPTNPVAITGGAGTNATFNLNFSVITGIKLVQGGTYSVQPTSPVAVTDVTTAGASGATLTLTFGRIDLSVVQTFTISVLFVNDAPSTMATNQGANENSGAHSVPNWATFNPGGAPDLNEIGQTALGYIVSGVTNAGLFTAAGQPKVSGAGTLTYTLQPNVSGASNFTVTVEDNGGTQAVSASIVSGGSGYAVGDLLTVQGGTFVTAAQLQVTSVDAFGGVTGVVVTLQDGAYSVQPANPVNVTDVTSAGAAGAQFTLGYAGVNISVPQTFTINVNLINDQPSFTASNPPPVPEDTITQQTVNGWVTAFNPGGAPDANEAGQAVLAYHVGAPSNPALFAVPPAVSASGNLTYTLNNDVSGTSTFTVAVQDNGGTQAVSAVIAAAGNGYAVGDLLNVQGGTFTTPAQIEVTSVGVGGAITGFTIFIDGTYSVQPASPVSVTDITTGTASGAKFTLTFGGIDTSATQTFTVSVLFVNDQPSFTASNLGVNEDTAGAQTVSGWATFNPGGAPDANEAGQKVLAYTVANVTNPSLFAILPSVSTTGNLTYTLNPNVSGTTNFDVKVQDNGGAQALAAAVVAGGSNYKVGDLLTVKGGTFTTAAQLQVTSIGAGGAITGAVVTQQDGVYTVLPTNPVSVTDVTTPAASGATIKLTTGGIDTSATQTLTLNVNLVNDQPSFTATNPPPIVEDTVAKQTVTSWATFNPGGAPDANEVSQTVLAYHVGAPSNPGLFAVAPAVDNSGNLTYTLKPDLSGTSTFTVAVQDNGGTQAVSAALVAAGTGYKVGDLLNVQGGTFTTAAQFEVTSIGALGAITGFTMFLDGTYSVQPANPVSVTDATTPAGSGATFNLTFGGVDTSATKTFTISVLFVNDQPSFTASNPPAANVDTGKNTVTGWATFNPGGAPDANELSQAVLAYTVSAVSNPTLFTVNPAVDNSGNLTYTLANGQTGTSTFTVVVEDNGGTQAVAAALVVAGSGYKVGDLLTVQGGTAVTPAQLQVTSIGAGGAITGAIVTQQDGAYTVQPANPVSVKDATTPAATGATFNLTFAGVNTSAAQTFTITVNTPVFTFNPATLPNATADASYSQTITATGGTAPYTYTISGGALPAGLTLSSTGILSGTPTVAGNFSFNVQATDANSISAVQGYSLTVNGPAIKISPATLTGVTAGVPFSQVLTASGGDGTYSNFTITAGQLPTGLTLSSSGTISSTPTAVGTFNFTVTVQDTTPGPAAPYTGSQAYSVTVAAPSITLTPSLPGAQAGAVYNQTLAASGGTAPYTFSLSSGTLPTGLSLAANGALTGTPTAVGSFTFTVQATDSTTGTGAPFTGSQSYTVAVAAPTISFTPATLFNTIAGVMYSQTLAGQGGTAPYSNFTITAGSLPTGLTFSSSGTISGTTSSFGTFTFTVRAQDSTTGAGAPYTGSQNYSLTVSAPFDPATLSAAMAGATYSQAITAVAGSGPATNFSVSGALPNGLSLSSAGLLSGTPTAVGSFTFTVSASDTSPSSGAFTATQQYTLTVSAPDITFTPATLTAAITGVAYSQTLTGADGTAPYSNFTLTAGVLPTGLTLSNGGVLAGTTTALGNYSFTVQAQDSTTGPAAPYKGSQNYTLTVSVPFSPASLPAAVAGASYSQAIDAITGTGPASNFSVTAGVLPGGVTLSTGGVLNGTPTAVGTFTFTVSASDTSPASGSFTANQQFSLTVSPPNIVIAPATLSAATAGVLYNQVLTGSGGNAPYAQFTIASGALPGGLTLSSSGSLAGTPTAVGTFSFTVQAQDSTTGPAAPYTGSTSYSLVVNPPVIAFSPANLTAATAGAVYSQPLSGVGGTAPYSNFKVTSGALPAGLTLSSAGVLGGTASAVGSFSFTVTAQDSTTGSAAPYTGTQNYALIVNPPTIVLSPSTLTGIAVGAPYNQTLTPSGGTAPYSNFKLISGSLPTGLSLNAATGVLSGTPTAAGPFSFTLQVQDSTTGAGAPYTGTQSYSLTVNAATIVLSALPAAQVGATYNQTIVPSGGTAPYTLSLTSGALPAGLTFNASTGAVTGKPTAGGTFHFTVSATDSSTGTGPYTGSQAYTFIVAPPTLVFSPSILPGAAVGASYNETLTVSGGTAPYSNFTISAGALPAGLTLSATGTFAGTPTAAGTFNFTVQATDSSTGSGPYTLGQNFSLTVAPPNLVVSPPSLPAGLVAVPYSVQIAVTGGTAPYKNFVVTTGTLPAGLTLSTTGLLSGMPTGGGTFNFTLGVTDSSTGSGPYSTGKAYSISVTPPNFSYNAATKTLTISGSNFQYSQSTTANASGTHTNYNFTMDGFSETLPDTTVSSVVVNGVGSSASAILITSDMYTAANGSTQETPERISLGSLNNDGVGTITRFTNNDASEASFTFLTLHNFPISYAYVGRNDSTVNLYGTVGEPYNGFVTAGNYSYMGGPGMFHLVQGAPSVYGYSAGQPADFAYHYAANPGSAFVVSGTAYSYMSTMDTVKGVTSPYFNVGVGFLQNTGVSKNGGADIAYFFDSPGNDTFVGGTTISYMYINGPPSPYAEFDAAYGFAMVNAESFVGGIDFAYIYDTTHNNTSGFTVIYPGQIGRIVD